MTSGQNVKSPVGVEKVHFSQNSRNLGDRKCLGKPRKSFVGHPNAILFLRISREGVFQQRRARPVVGAKRKGTCLGRPISASLDGAPGNGSRPSWQWWVLERRTTAWLQVPCAEQWLTVGASKLIPFGRVPSIAQLGRCLQLRKRATSEQETGR